ncbi:MAG: MBL fold metallo-hydrolase [Candidatus Campbellbacteria bacterium]|nr:MBL fold metallo-hydrolase [Candidatus Campbellbacteria bacterium]
MLSAGFISFGGAKLLQTNLDFISRIYTEHMRSWKLYLFALALLVFITGSIWYVAHQFEREPVLTVAFLDIGQGDSIFIESPSGKQMLIDGGPDKHVIQQLSRVMPFFDRSVDVVLNTHPDKDHIGGLPEILRRYDVSYVMDPGIESDSGTYGYYIQLVEQEIQKGGKYIEARRGQIINFQDGAYVRILFPDRDVSAVTNNNNASIVVQVVYGNTEVMLTGDAPQSIEKYVVALDGATLKSDILKAGHHGSRTSSSPEFVRAVSPTYAIISAGKDNQYGHPHKEVMQLFASSSIQTLATYDLGIIIFESDGKTVKVESGM